MMNMTITDCVDAINGTGPGVGLGSCTVLA